jgi:hypothetical protein
MKVHDEILHRHKRPCNHMRRVRIVARKVTSSWTRARVRQASDIISNTAITARSLNTPSWQDNMQI